MLANFDFILTKLFKIQHISTLFYNMLKQQVVNTQIWTFLTIGLTFEYFQLFQTMILILCIFIMMKIYKATYLLFQVHILHILEKNHCVFFTLPTMSREGKKTHLIIIVFEGINLDLSIKIVTIMHKFSQNINFNEFGMVKSHLRQIFTQYKRPEVLEEFLDLK